MRAVTLSLAFPVLGSTIFCLPITVKMPDRAPLVAHFFRPDRMMKSPFSSFSIRVSWPPASQPTLGSERQKAERVSLQMRGRKVVFWASVPKSMMAPHPMDWWAETTTAVEPQVSPRRASTRLYEVIPKPPPPYCWGAIMPMTPRSKRRVITQSGMFWVWSISTVGCSVSR